MSCDEENASRRASASPLLACCCCYWPVQHHPQAHDAAPTEACSVSRLRRDMAERGCGAVPERSSCDRGRSAGSVPSTHGNRTRNPGSHNGGRSWSGSPRPHCRASLCGGVPARWSAGAVRRTKRRVSLEAGRLARCASPGLSLARAGALRPVPANDRLYLLGADQLLGSDDGGQSLRLGPEWPQMSEITVLVGSGNRGPLAA